MERSRLQSFEIDGKLWALSREQAFTLGVEWGVVWHQVAQSVPFVVMIHAENSERISGMLVQQKRAFSVKPAGAEWVTISVAGLQ